MDKNDLISVIVPLYNTSNYMDDCIKSICHQTYINIEILLIDDGSTDDTGIKINEWRKRDNRIQVYHKKNGGLSDARNYGIEKASGKYITFIDSDDYVADEMIAYLHDLIVKYSTDISLCTHTVISGNKKIINGDNNTECLNDKEAIERMLYHNVIDTSAWAKLYDISLFKKIRFPKGKLFEDIATTYKLFIKAQRIACGYKDLYFYIIRNNSITTSKYSRKKLDLIEMTDQMADEVLEKYPDLISATMRRRLYARFSTLNQMIFCNPIPSESEDIVLFIKKYRTKVLLDFKAPFRDKVAIIALSVNLKIYKKIWKLYKYISLG